MDLLQEAYTDSEEENTVSEETDNKKEVSLLSYDQLVHTKVDYLGLDDQSRPPVNNFIGNYASDAERQQNSLQSFSAGYLASQNYDTKRSIVTVDAEKTNDVNSCFSEDVSEVSKSEAADSLHDNVSESQDNTLGSGDSGDVTIPVKDTDPGQKQIITIENGVESKVSDDMMYRDVLVKKEMECFSEDSCSSSSVSSLSDDEDPVVLADVSSSDEDEHGKSKDKEKKSGGKPKTRGEFLPEDLPPIEDLQISVAEDVILQELGCVSAIVDTLVVVKSLCNLPALDDDSILFLEGRRAFGQVFETFGPVSAPFYSVRFNSADHIQEKGVSVGVQVFFAPDMSSYTKYVFLAQLQQMKGSDASWEHNNEPPARFLDYSDDEEERRAKARRRGKNVDRKEACDDPDDGKDETDCLPNKQQHSKYRKKDHVFSKDFTTGNSKQAFSYSQPSKPHPHHSYDHAPSNRSQPQWSHPRQHAQGHKVHKQWPPGPSDQDNRLENDFSYSSNQMPLQPGFMNSNTTGSTQWTQRPPPPVDFRNMPDRQGPNSMNGPLNRVPNEATAEPFSMPLKHPFLHHSSEQGNHNPLEVNRLQSFPSRLPGDLNTPSGRMNCTPYEAMNNPSMLHAPRASHVNFPDNLSNQNTACNRNPNAVNIGRMPCPQWGAPQQTQQPRFGAGPIFQRQSGPSWY